MMKWIRWQGLIAFFVVVGALMALWFIFVDGIVETLIEKTGMAIVGAEVDVKADVNLFPLGITLRELQVTNPETPARNSFECSRIAFNLDSLNLLRRKVIINEMAVEGMRFDTQRKRPGRVSKEAKEQKKAAEEKPSVFGLPVQTPDVKTILKNENLESLKLIEETRSDLEKKKTDWQKRVKEMPDRAKIDGYDDRIEKIRKQARGNVLNMAGSLAEFRAVRRDIEQDIERVRQARKAFTADLGTAKTALERAQQAPFNDVRRLRDKYSISPAGLANISQLLFGDQIASWVRTGLLWRSRIEPVVERMKAQKGDVKVVKHVRERGVDVRFKEYRPLPDFLIARSAVTAETAAGLLAGTVKNITPDQDVLGIPLTFSLTGEKLKAAQSVAITGALNHVNPAKSEDSAKAVVRALRVNNLVLSGMKDLPVSLQEGLVDLNLQGSFTEALRATFTADFNSARMSVGGGESTNPFVAAVRSALTKVNRFSLTANMAGTLENYSMNISSDLDNVLKGAVGSVVQEQSAKLEQQLKTAIQERTGGQLKDLQNIYGGLNEQGGALNNIQNQLNEVLQNAIKGAGGRLKLP
jgi:uncharacterized protein (TIGR03545 family)